MGAPIADIETVDVVEPAATVPAAPAVDTASPPQSIDRIGVLLKDVAPVGPTGADNVPAVLPEAQSAAPSAAGRQRRRYSPAVQRLADEHGVDMSQVRGTGMGGRITRKDVLAYIESAGSERVEVAPAATPTPTSKPVPTAPSIARTAEGDEERVPLSPVRRMIAANMKRSASEIPAAWSITEVDVSGLVRRRNALKGEFMWREGVNLTYLHFVIKAVAESLRENPLLNSSWGDDAIILKRRINIGIAVAAPDGLVVPVLQDADTLSVAGIAVRASELTAKARQGKLSVEDVQAGTFT